MMLPFFKKQYVIPAKGPHTGHSQLFRESSMPTTSHFRLNLLYGCLIVLTGVLIYANSLQNSFLYDDRVYIVHNPSIYHLSDFKTIVDDTPRRWVGTWSFALNYALGGLDVRGYHIFNVLIHLSCGLAVGWLFCLILSVPKFQSWGIAAEKEKLAFWAALLFITHPVQTMAVDHITQRYVALAALFYLTSLCFYFKGRLSKGRRRGVFFLASGLAGFLGIFTRETVVTLPLAFVLCEVLILMPSEFPFWSSFPLWPSFPRKRESITRLILKWIPAFAGMTMFIIGIVLFLYRFNIIYLLTKAHYYSQSHQGEIITSFNYFLTQFRVMVVYIRLLFWPAGLNFDYDMPLSHSFWEPDVMSGFLLIVLLFIYALRVRIKYPIVSFSIFWFFLTLSLESTIFPISYVITEYRLYLPLFGFCIGFVSVMRALIKDRRAFTILMGLIVLIFSILTMQRNRVYKDEVSLWTDTIKQSPYKSRPYASLGAAYINRGDYPKALEYLHRALAIEPGNYAALVNLAKVYGNTGVFDKAIAIDERLLGMYPSAIVYNDLGEIYYIRGDLNKAQGYFYKAIRAQHFYQETYLNLAKVYLRKGQIKEAKEIYLKVLFLYPYDNRARYALIPLYLASRQFPQVEALAKDILSSKNNDPRELVNIGSVFASKGYSNVAFVFFTKAVSTDYTYPGSYRELGKFLYNQHRLDDAIHVWQLGLKYTVDAATFKDLINQAQKLKIQAQNQKAQ